MDTNTNDWQVRKFAQYSMRLRVVEGGYEVYVEEMPTMRVVSDTPAKAWGKCVKMILDGQES